MYEKSISYKNVFCITSISALRKADTRLSLVLCCSIINLATGFGTKYIQFVFALSWTLLKKYLKRYHERERMILRIL